MTVAAALALGAVTVGTGAAVIAVVMVLGQRRHRENVELLTLVEAQMRATRHAIKDLAATLGLRRLVESLDGDGDLVGVDVDEERASR